MSPENLNSSSIVGDLSSQLDEETMVMSGGFDRLDAFQQIIEQGESALPELLSDMDEPSWWRMQAVWTIAHAVGKTIEYPEEIRGKYLEVRDITVDWAKAHGYITREPTAE